MRRTVAEPLARLAPWSGFFFIGGFWLGVPALMVLSAAYVGGLVVFALATLPAWLDNAYILHVLVVTGIFIVAAMSLNLLLGYAGQLSLGHVAFFGIGAYASALVSLGFDVSFFSLKPKPVWLAMLAGIVAAGICGPATFRADAPAVLGQPALVIIALAIVFSRRARIDPA